MRTVARRTAIPDECFFILVTATGGSCGAT
jgi:hypothetical protein